MKKQIIFKGTTGIVVGKLEAKNLQEMEGSEFNMYGLRHSDNSYQVRTIEKKSVLRVNSFGIYVTKDKLEFKEDDYYNLSEEERKAFTAARRGNFEKEDLQLLLRVNSV